MKTINKIILLFSIYLFATGCDDSFLDDTEQQTTIVARTALYLSPSTGYREYPVTVPNAGNAVYSIGLLPKWMTFQYLKGSFKNDTVLLKFTVQNIPATLEPGTYESILTLIIENVEIHQIPVYFVNE